MRKMGVVDDTHTERRGAGGSGGGDGGIVAYGERPRGTKGGMSSRCARPREKGHELSYLALSPEPSNFFASAS
jgi:hypothetical protein